jgi:hypothetical protein
VKLGDVEVGVLTRASRVTKIIGKKRLHYIHENPVKNGIVENAWEYIYSSARDYEINRKGLVEIEFA